MRANPSRPSATVQVGSSAPEFTLATPHGVEVRLTSCLVEGNLLLEFVRGTWDPDARRRLAALAEARERLRDLGAKVLVVACERPPAAARYLEERPLPLTLLLDETRAVARGYGVLQRFSLPRWNVARPASFVIDRCGFVRYAWVARLPIHAAPLEEVCRTLAELAGRRRGGTP
ncbi:MAG: redoxin domain-containing protein [Planctomycetes bacterium]|nr:redoxin domain-containing protein [Planctomycetota bacterium]